MYKFFLLYPVILIAANAAFLTSCTRVPFIGAIMSNVAHSTARLQEFDISSQPSLVVQPSSVWVKESAMSQAIHCAEDECDTNEMMFHISSLMQLDDECLFYQAFESTPLNHECDNTKDRKLIQRILQLKHELQLLEQELKDNAFANSVKKDHEAKLQDHWYKDYLDFYHM